MHHRPGIVHNLFDYSPDMEYIEVVIPADFASIDVEGPAKVPLRLREAECSNWE